ncbi:MAG: poly(R)-hydroxyalkanoic acid synthase subunit PhaC [uncultured bacterium]|nr:MAG: poly(R)-hydroxyalkanoic acid synthase subunit PhaC [uncultured bacterium]
MIGNMDTLVQHLDAITEHVMRKTAGELDNYPRGVTPREEVYNAGNVSLLRFISPEGVEGTPLLIIPSLINRWYILDVTEETSFIRQFAQQRPTYLIDWGYPDDEVGHLPLSHYYHRSIKRAVRQISRQNNVDKVDMLGYCIGGTMAYAFACLEPKLVDHLVLLTAPIDFTDAGIFATYAEHFPIEEFSASMNKMPGWLLAFSFQFVQPLGVYQKTKMFHDKFESQSFAKLYNAMERWIADPVSFPAKAYYELITDLYKKNLLAQGRLMTADGLPVDPAARRAKTLILNAGKDHIAPLTTTALPASDQAPVSEITISSGHIGITTGRNGKTACKNAIDFLMN